MTPHLDPAAITSYVDHQMSLAERHAAEEHLALCPECIDIVAGVVKTLIELAPELAARADVAQLVRVFR